jgi:hypothetical protein
LPFLSEAQNRWAHTPAGTKALGGPEHVKEWESVTDYSKLPERKGDRMGNCPHCGAKPEHWMQSAIKRPGSLTRAARAHGVSKLEEARKEAHSTDPHIRGRGILGERLIKKTI